jgi:hypothetical protein
MNQRLWVYQASDESFWLSREPLFDRGAEIPAPGPAVEIGTAEVEPYELMPRTRDSLAYGGIARLAAVDEAAILIRLEPTVLRPPVLGVEYRYRA